MEDLDFKKNQEWKGGRRKKKEEGYLGSVVFVST